MWKLLKRRKNLGGVALGGWLILFGLTQAIHLSFIFSQTLLGVMAILAGVLILIDR